ncbi:dephospho-CoA kinase [Paracoccaceae bacterium]|nr:dephospho-CoA kinase [Paracoccaceae bacterium]
MKKENRFVLGLTGSIAMGKTTVSSIFKELNVPVWCADTEVTKLYSLNGLATLKISRKFPSVVSNNGVNKLKLKELIHKDNKILKQIEEIVHPLLDQSKTLFLKTYKKKPLVVFDIPLLFEKNQEKNFDGTLVVTASEQTQRSRVLKRDNYTEKDFYLIRSNQMGEKEKIKRASFVINTDKDMNTTKKEVLNLYNKLVGVF